MKEEYDLASMKRRKNPYAKRLKKQITIRINPDAIDYFRSLSEETGIPYQNLINLYLSDCARNQKKLNLEWS